MTARRDGGFTLLEVLVALVVLGFLVLGLSQGVQFGLKALDTQSRTLAARDGLDSVDRALRRLVALTDPGDAVEHPRFYGGERSLRFVTELPAAAGALASPRVDVALLVDQAHRLMLMWTPSLHAARFGPPPPPQATELLGNIDHLEFAYWRPAAAGGGWQKTWTLPYLPALVRIRIVFPRGDPRRWPDIIAAPVLERLEQ